MKSSFMIIHGCMNPFFSPNHIFLLMPLPWNITWSLNKKNIFPSKSPLWRAHLQVACNSRPLSMCDLAMALMVEIPFSIHFQNPSDVQEKKHWKITVFWSIFSKHGEYIVVNMKHLQNHPPVVFFSKPPPAQTDMIFSIHFTLTSRSEMVPQLRTSKKSKASPGSWRQSWTGLVYIYINIYTHGSNTICICGEHMQRYNKKFMYIKFCTCLHSK